MRCLVLTTGAVASATPSASPPPRRIAIDESAIIVGLVANGHEVTVLSMGGPADDEAKVATWASVAITHIAAGLPDRHVLSMLRSPSTWYLSKQYVAMATALMEKCDAVIDADVWSANVSSPDGMPRISTLHYSSAMDRQPWSFFNRKEGALEHALRYSLRSYHQRRAMRAASCIRVFGRHMQAWTKQVSGANTVIIPHGIDVSAYDTVIRGQAKQRTYGCLTNRLWGPSSSAGDYYLRVIRGLIQELDPGAQHVIAGWGTNPAESAAHNTRFIGPVSNIREFFDQIDVLVVPGASGSGVRVKVLEAMAFGVPVVGGASAAHGILDDVGGMLPELELLTFSDDPVRLAASAVDAAARSSDPEIKAAMRRYLVTSHGPQVIAKAIVTHVNALRQ